MERKMIKFTIFLFMLCLMMSIYSVNAGTLGFLSIKLPVLKGNYESDFKYKETKTNQTYSSNGTTLNNGTLIDVEVNLHKTGVPTDWRALSKNEMTTWSTIDYTTYGTYRMEFQQDASRLQSAIHSGVWAY